METTSNQDTNAANRFFRCGDEVYEILSFSAAHNARNTLIKKRSRQSLRERFGNNFIAGLDYYDDFVNEPIIIDHKKVVTDSYNPELRRFNLFPEPPYNPNPANGRKLCYDLFKAAPTWMDLLSHVFEEHAELGLHYLGYLVQKPKQMLPVLVLMSEENQTGKTTFLNALHMLLGQGMSFASYDDLMSGFNSYAKSLVIGFEEVSKTKGAMDKIKNLSTAKHITLNEKHMPQVVINSYAKIVICSNNTTGCIKASNKDIRYWVRKLKPLEKFDPRFDDKLRAEAPVFLDILSALDLREPKSRMVFTAEELRTEALDDIRRNSLSNCAQELQLFISENLELYGEFTASLKEIRAELGTPFSSHTINKTLRRELGYQFLGNQRYQTRAGISNRGFCYRFSKLL